MDPKFSVIIPTFNRARVLPRAIKSVRKQTYENFEIIIVDDASTDSTRRVVEQFDDNRIQYINLSENRGPAAARNKGIKKARGEYISLLDSDDEYLPEFLQETLNALEGSGNEIGFSWTGTICIANKETEELKRRQIIKRLWTPHYQNTEEAYKDCLCRDPVWGTGHGVTIKAEVFNQIGLMDEELKAREDIDILIRLIKKYKFKVIPRYLVKIHTDGGRRVDDNYLNKALAYIKIYRKHLPAIQNNKKAFLFFNRTIADNFTRAGHHRKAVQYLLKILRKNPKKRRTLKQLIFSLLRMVKP